jgi:hypothetical protein
MRLGKLSVYVHVYGTPGFVSGVANIFQEAFGAFGTAGEADFASMPDDLMGVEYPSVAREDLHEVLFDLFGIFVNGEFQTL